MMLHGPEWLVAFSCFSPFFGVVVCLCFVYIAHCCYCEYWHLSIYACWAVECRLLIRRPASLVACYYGGP